MLHVNHFPYHLPLGEPRWLAGPYPSPMVQGIFELGAAGWGGLSLGIPGRSETAEK